VATGAFSAAASAVAALGVEAGDVVSIQLPDWWQALALELACWRRGAMLASVTTTTAVSPDQDATAGRCGCWLSTTRAGMTPGTWPSLTAGEATGWSDGRRTGSAALS
jgi:acyl-coenzyme A synthetase/AMP-(fatty) acid ligase